MPLSHLSGCQAVLSHIPLSSAVVAVAVTVVAAVAVALLYDSLTPRATSSRTPGVCPCAFVPS